METSAFFAHYFLVGFNQKLINLLSFPQSLLQGTLGNWYYLDLLQISFQDLLQENRKKQWCFFLSENLNYCQDAAFFLASLRKMPGLTFFSMYR